MATKEEEILALGWDSVEQYESFMNRPQAWNKGMNVFKVIFEDGDWLTTGFNGTLADAEKYYLGQTFNLGGVNNPSKDRLVKGVKVEQIK